MACVNEVEGALLWFKYKYLVSNPLGHREGVTEDNFDPEKVKEGACHSVKDWSVMKS